MVQSAPAVSPSVRRLRRRTGPTLIRLAALATFSHREKGREGEIDPSFLITHKIKLEDGPDAYKMFQEKNDGCIKVVINP